MFSILANWKFLWPEFWCCEGGFRGTMNTSHCWRIWKMKNYRKRSKVLPGNPSSKKAQNGWPRLLPQLQGHPNLLIRNQCLLVQPKIPQCLYILFLHQHIISPATYNLLHLRKGSHHAVRLWLTCGSSKQKRSKQVQVQYVESAMTLLHGKLSKGLSR